MTEFSLLQKSADFQKCWELSDKYHRILMDRGMLEQMIIATSRQLHRLGYKESRNLALDTYKFTDQTDEEKEAYKDFIDRFFNRKAVAGTKRKHRPRTPIAAYEDDKH